MWHLFRPFLNFAFQRLPIVTVPFAIVIGFIGYNIENLFSDKYTPPIKSAMEQRQERLLEENKKPDSIKEKKFVPETVFERNLSPSLLSKDTRGEKYKA